MTGLWLWAGAPRIDQGGEEGGAGNAELIKSKASMLTDVFL